MLPSRLALPPAKRARVVDVARGRSAPDLILVTDEMVDVYSRRTRPAAIAISEGRVAWVRDPAQTDMDQGPTVRLSGTVVPALVEPHCHPDILYTPSALAAQVALHGTSTLVADLAFLSLRLGDDALHDLVTKMGASSVKFLWNVRPCLDGVLPVELDRMRAERLTRLLADLPDVVGTGEMTAWPALLAGDERLGAIVNDAIERGLRVDGHAAGASPDTLGALSAAGITADHEAITAQQLVDRCRQGHWVMLRHSSLRPDGRELAAALVSGDVPVSRVMLTTDGPVVADLVDGHLDTIVREIVQAGVDPLDAVCMASLNPAVYFGLDGHIGGIAPGRCADFLVVDSLRSFRPEQVVLDGMLIEPDLDERNLVEWSTLPTDPLLPAELSSHVLVEECISGPRAQLQGIITRRVEPSGAVSTDTCHVALIARDGTWMVGGTIEGLEISALASTFTGSGDVVLLGRDAAMLVELYRRVVDRGGGIATQNCLLALEGLGYMFDGSTQELMDAWSPLLADLALPTGGPPLEYLLLFFTIGILPDVRYSPIGSLDVKTGEVIREPLALRPRGLS